MFSGKVAVVTGAAKGIGSAVARHLARQGARLVLGDMDLAGLERVRDGIDRETGVEALIRRVDVSDPESVSGLISLAVDNPGRLDLLVNNAGICPFTPLEEVTVAEWDRVMEVNLRSVFLTCRAALPEFKRRKGGAVVNIASISAKTGGVTVGPHYTASKAGVIGLTKSFAAHLAPYGVRVNAVAPGPVDTPMARTSPPEVQARMKSGSPLGGMATAVDIAEAVLFLLSDRSRHITGATMDVNGGLLMD